MPTWIGSLFGNIYSAQAKTERDTWHVKINATIGQIALIGGTLASALNWIIDEVYNPKIDDEYNNGVQVGDSIYNDYFSQIQGGLDQAKAYADQVKNTLNDLITKARSDVDSLNGIVQSVQTKVDDAKSKVASLNSDMASAQSVIDDLKTRVASLEKTGVPTKKTVSPSFPKFW